MANVSSRLDEARLSSQLQRSHLSSSGRHAAVHGQQELSPKQGALAQSTSRVTSPVPLPQPGFLPQAWYGNSGAQKDRTIW